MPHGVVEWLVFIPLALLTVVPGTLLVLAVLADVVTGRHKRWGVD
jgi:hypothetical protein